MPDHTTAELDASIAKLESRMKAGTAEIEFQSRRMIYHTPAEIRDSIAYFKSLYPTAVDAPTQATKKVRTFFFNGSKDF